MLTPSAASEVTSRSVSPQGTIRSNQLRSRFTLRENPCIERALAKRSPTAPILRGCSPAGSTHTPTQRSKRPTFKPRQVNALIRTCSTLFAYAAVSTSPPPRLPGTVSIGYTTSWPGPWYVASPPRSALQTVAPKASTSVRICPALPREPKVMVCGCSSINR